jgi:HAD superfamily hydrolase (TIGR01509 family)
MPHFVLLDIDGTLIDSVDAHARAWELTFRHFGRDVPFDQIRSQIGKGGDQLMPVFLPQDEIEQKGKEIEQYRGDLFRREFLPQIKPFPRVPELFERIRADGKKIALATSSKKEDVAALKRIAGIEGLTDDEASAGDAERSKPHPDIFEAALAHLGHADPREAISIGDTPYDALAGGKIGLRTIGVLCGGFPEKDLRGAGCIALYRDPADLLDHYPDSPLARP